MISIDAYYQFKGFGRVSIDIYRTRQMSGSSYFWPDWSSYVRLGVFNNIFNTKRTHSYFFQRSPSQILNYRILIICRILLYCSMKKLEIVLIDTYCPTK